MKWFRSVKCNLQHKTFPHFFHSGVKVQSNSSMNMNTTEHLGRHQRTDDLTAAGDGTLMIYKPNYVLTKLKPFPRVITISI